MPGRGGGAPRPFRRAHLVARWIERDEQTHHEPQFRFGTTGRTSKFGPAKGRAEKAKEAARTAAPALSAAEEGALAERKSYLAGRILRCDHSIQKSLKQCLFSQHMEISTSEKGAFKYCLRNTVPFVLPNVPSQQT
jgi:hypothetical protein